MTREIRLPDSQVALVDAADYEAVAAAGPWHARRSKRTTYVQRHVLRGGRRTTQQLHQFLTGQIGVDHINGDGLDNRRSNLRVATHSQNMANARGSATSTCPYKGVTLRKQSRGRFTAQIRVDGVQRHIGNFATAEEAARAYDAAALAAWGDFARLNFPEEQAA